ncbi:site-specific integrase [Chromobacterium piscinae]|uniref:site-specific integrase n=1 Tax=Chromobacterium piscinae TaxID=686831 RepID=UPI0035EFEFC0
MRLSCYRPSWFLAQTKLLLTHRLPDGRQAEYWAADALEARFRVLNRAAGIKTSSHAGRRSFSSRLLKSGVSLEQLAILLGHQDTEVTSAYIQVERKTLRSMYEHAL